MRPDAQGPPRCDEWDGLDQRGFDQSMPHAFPVCNLHGRRIVDNFPRECPLIEPRATVAILALQDGGYAKLSTKRAGEIHDGLMDLERADICYACLRDLSPHPHVAQLRAQARQSTATTSVPPGGNGVGQNRSGFSVRRLPRRRKAVAR